MKKYTYIIKKILKSNHFCSIFVPISLAIMVIFFIGIMLLTIRIKNQYNERLSNTAVKIANEMENVVEDVYKRQNVGFVAIVEVETVKYIVMRKVT